MEAVRRSKGNGPKLEQVISVQRRLYTEGSSQRGLEVFSLFEWLLLIKETGSRFVRGNDKVLLGLFWILNFQRIRPQHLSVGLSIHSSIHPTFIGYTHL